MHCIVKKTLETIINSDNNYVIAVKKNQLKLYNQISELSEKWKNKIDYYKSQEKNRGRKEIRKVYVYRASQEIRNSWVGVCEIVKVVRERTANGETNKKTWYYISSMSASAKEYARGIRSHWLIENRLHWVKDVTMNEDHGTIRSFQAAPILSIISTIVLNIIRMQECNDCKNFMGLIAHNIEQMLVLIE